MANIKKKHSEKLQLFCAGLFFASLNFEVFAPFVKNLSIGKMAAFLYLLVMLPQLSTLFNTNRIQKYIFLSFFLFFIFVFSSAINGSCVIFDTTIFLNIIVFWIILNHSKKYPDFFTFCFLCFAISSFVVSVLFLLGIGVEMRNVQSGRLTVFGTNENNVGFSMAISILFLVNYCLNHSVEKQIYKPWLLLMAIPMVILLFATGSRTAFIAFSVAIVVFVFLRKSKNVYNKIVFFVIFGIFAMVFYYRFVLSQDVLVSRFQNENSMESFGGRTDIWTGYIQTIKMNPILGVGFDMGVGSTRFMQGDYASPHNVFIEVALYSGLIGLMVFLLFLYCVFKVARFGYKKTGNIMYLLFIIVQFLYLFTGQALGRKLFWMICACAISCGYIMNYYMVNRENKILKND